MSFVKLAVFGLSSLMFCATLQAGIVFQVSGGTFGSTSPASFGEMQLGKSRTLSFNVTNLLSTPLAVTITKNDDPRPFYTMSEGTITLAPNETRQVPVTFPAIPRCMERFTRVTITSPDPNDQATVFDLHSKLLCPQLSLGPPPQLRLSLEGNNIRARFGVGNIGTLPSAACQGQILLDGSVVQTFNIPAFAPSANFQIFEPLIPAGPGSHTVEVRLDTNNQNNEAFEDRESATIFSTPPPPPPPDTVTITISKSGTGSGTVTAEGINCGFDCSQSVTAGTSVGLRAAPASNSFFRKWTGGTGSATVCNESAKVLCGFTASQNSKIMAVFELID